MGPLHYSAGAGRGHTAALLTSGEAVYSLIRIPSRKTSNRFGVEAVGVFTPSGNMRGRPRVTTRNAERRKDASYLVPMSFRAASLNVYPIAGHSFVSLQCF